MSKPLSRRQKAIRKRRIFLSICTVILVAVTALIIFAVNGLKNFDNGNDNGNKNNTTSDIVTSETSDNNTSSKTDSVDDKVYNATVISTGDIILHSTVVDGAKTSSGGYDFSAFFKKVTSYFKGADLAVANFENTIADPKKYPYIGYPTFNSPESLVDVCKNAGLGLLLTANNHSYDTGFDGITNTPRVMKAKGMPFIGTKETESDPKYLVKDVNGINLGITCYTYATFDTAGNIRLNGLKLKTEANNLVNCFDYNYIDRFYSEVKTVLENMKKDGADAIVFYIHWGNEYQLKPNTWQKSIAQKLADMGVDVIVGGHPHVVQPIDIIHGEGRDEPTVCLYSMGNAISNQRKELMDSEPTGHTEDGLMFSCTFEKQSGKTHLKAVDIIPTWVDKYKGGSGYQYTMFPIESKTAAQNSGETSSRINDMKLSYDRTMKVVGEGLTKCQTELGCKVRTIE